MKSAPVAAWRVHDVMTALLLAGIVTWLLIRAHAEPYFGIEVRSAVDVTIRDFAAHFVFVKAVWSGAADYGTLAHLEVVRAWSGMPVQLTLPFGYSPTMMWLLLPLTVLSPIGAYTVWTLGSAAAVWWLTRARRAIWLLTPLVLLSAVGGLCLALGQTALLSVAALVFLMHEGRSSGGSTKRDVAGAVVLWTLTAKPPLALVGGAALLGARRFRPVLGAAALTGALTLIITPVLGWTWPSDYLHLLTHYDRASADSAFAWSLKPEAMANLRSLLFGTVGDGAATRISLASWGVATGAIVLRGLRKGVSGPITWIGCITAYLLLFPHVSGPEVLHVAAFLAAVKLASADGLDATPETARFSFASVGPGLVVAVFLAVLLAPTATSIPAWWRSLVVFGAILCAALFATRAVRGQRTAVK